MVLILAGSSSLLSIECAETLSRSPLNFPLFVLRQFFILCRRLTTSQSVNLIHCSD